jgi:hypothetical protein
MSEHMSEQPLRRATLQLYSCCSSGESMGESLKASLNCAALVTGIKTMHQCMPMRLMPNAARRGGRAAKQAVSAQRPRQPTGASGPDRARGERGPVWGTAPRPRPLVYRVG